MALAISNEAALAFTGAKASSSGAAVTVRGLAKSYGATRVLRDLDLHAPAGQFLAIVGRSGCGKSTLLRLIAGLESPDAGRIAREGEARVMFQEPRLLPWARVLANVEVGFGPERTHPDAPRLAREALEAVGLAERAGEWPSVLSGGQKNASRSPARW
jgi:sulfonate transport system ATP-binding protein